MKLLPLRTWVLRTVGQAGLAGLVCLSLMAVTATRAGAAVHPVPLDKNVDAKKCLECHDDKTKHKFVHSAMQGDV